MNLRTMDLNLLVVFDAIMHERNVSQAAARVGRSQSALSHSLKKLRSAFNDDLFIRTARQMEPTPRALELAGPISSILADIQGTLDRYHFFNPRKSKRNFHVGMSDSIAFMFLPYLINQFRLQAPNASINIRNVSASRGYQLLRTGELDCIILGNAPKVAENLRSEKILTEKFLCAGWSQNLILKKPLTLKSYLSCPHLNIAVDGLSLGQVDAVLKKRNLSRNIVAVISHYLVAPWLLVGTDLIATSGEAPFLALSGACSITLAKPPIQIPEVVFSMITDQRVELDPGNMWLRSLLKKRAEDLRKQKERLYNDNPHLFS